MKIENLSAFEKDALLRKLLHVMSQETRGEIMAEMPVIYTKLAPHTSRVVLERVAVRVDREAAKST